jgi:hypothetical protein
MMPMLLAATIELKGIDSDFTMIPMQSQSYTMPVYDAPGPWIQNEDNTNPTLICKPIPGSKTKLI